MPLLVVAAVIGVLLVMAKVSVSNSYERSNDLLGYPYLESPNKGSRGSAKVTTLVWHYTAGITASSAISWLRNSEAKASAHFVIGRDGAVTQLVRLSEAAWHAGTASVTNAASIGVEVVNPGQVQPDGRGGWTIDAAGARVPWVPDLAPVQCRLRWPSGKAVDAWWVPYTPAQTSAMLELVRRLKETSYGIVCSDMRGHEDIATPEGRKTDPGPLFPWDIFGDKYTAWQKHMTTRVG